MSRSRVVLALAGVAVVAAGALAAVPSAAHRSSQRAVGTASSLDGHFVHVVLNEDLIPSQRRDAPLRARQRTLQGSQVDLASWRGHVVVLNFWASWCPPCRMEAPELAQAATASRLQGVTFLGVDVRDNASAARRFEKNHRMPYPSWDDSNGAVLARMPVSLSLPSTLILDRRGRVAVRFTGSILAAELRGAINGVLSEPS
jgi:thiol-disulfide isomerase/thioredoxin